MDGAEILGARGSRVGGRPGAGVSSRRAPERDEPWNPPRLDAGPARLADREHTMLLCRLRRRNPLVSQVTCGRRRGHSHAPFSGHCEHDGLFAVQRLVDSSRTAAMVTLELSLVLAFDPPSSRVTARRPVLPGLRVGCGRPKTRDATLRVPWFTTTGVDPILGSARAATAAARGVTPGVSWRTLDDVMASGCLEVRSAALRTRSACRGLPMMLAKSRSRSADSIVRSGLSSFSSVGQATSTEAVGARSSRRCPCSAAHAVCALSHGSARWRLSSNHWAKRELTSIDVAGACRGRSSASLIDKATCSARSGGTALPI